jgi:cysteinyl-tRNA synthetase
MQASRKALSKLSDFATKFGFKPSQGSSLETEFGPFHPVQEALLSDLNTPEALGRCFRLIRELGEAFERGEYEGEEEALNEVRRGFQATCDAFGLIVEPKVESAEEAPAEIQNLAQRRWEAKQGKDWALADQLRDELLAQGWAVKDGKEGFEIVPADS